MTEQDRGDIAEAQRRAAERTRPYSELRKELALDRAKAMLTELKG